MNNIQLKEKLNNLQLLLPEGKKTSDIAAKLTDICYHMEENPNKFDTVTFKFEDDVIHVNIGASDQIQNLEVGSGKWTEGHLVREGIKEHVMLTGIWKDTTKLLIQFRHIETPFGIQFLFTFNQDE